MVTETPRADALVEGIVYRDTGCDLHRAGCLSCPLPACKYDRPAGGHSVRVDDLAADVLALRSAGLAIEEIADRMGRSRRTIFRLLRRATRTG